MIFNILVRGGAYDSAAGRSAIRFCQAALASGHEIRQVFFYGAGVTQGNALAETLSDEFNANRAWESLAQDHDCSLVVCVSAAERRGVIGVDQAVEFGQDHHNLGTSFSVEGLGSFHAACLESDRTVTFK